MGAVVLLLGAAGIVVPTASGNHAQHGIAFVPKGGNEWWVQLQITGSMSGFMGYPQVRDTGGEWETMDHPSWAPNEGYFASSYHVEPGHKVQFRLEYYKSSQWLLSCWFTHPQGVESCDGSENFAVTFRPSPGSEQIRVQATSAQTLRRVSADLPPGGCCVELTRRPDGAWSRGGHVPDGTLVRFSAESDDSGEFATSGCFRWPAATGVACPSEALAIGFDPKPVEGDWSRVDAQISYFPDPPAKMQVRFDGGDFADMRIVDRRNATYDGAPATGSHVLQFRGILADGGTSCRSEGFRWPYSGTYAPSLGGGTGQVFFREQRGNTGWVQTNVYAGMGVVAVEAQVNGGPWTALTKQPYCDWAKAMSAPQGSSVRFRAFFGDLSFVESGPASWPPSGTMGPPLDFRPQFWLVKGNEWWVQTAVTPTDQVQGVEVRINGGPWKPLAFQSWGSWTASYRIPEGSVVQFLATSKGGVTGLSACYHWIPPQTGGQDAATVPCAPPKITATFTPVKGNEWWVETNVSADQPLAGVDARVNCASEWHPLTLRGWGNWAASFHVPAGAKVDFRAASTSGTQAFSGAYSWPSATPTSGC